MHLCSFRHRNREAWRAWTKRAQAALPILPRSNPRTLRQSVLLSVEIQSFAIRLPAIRFFLKGRQGDRGNEWIVLSTWDWSPAGTCPKYMSLMRTFVEPSSPKTVAFSSSPFDGFSRRIVAWWRSLNELTVTYTIQHTTRLQCFYMIVRFGCALEIASFWSAVHLPQSSFEVV